MLSLRGCTCCSTLAPQLLYLTLFMQFEWRLCPTCMDLTSRWNFQVQNPHSIKYNGTIQGLKYIWRTEGLRGLFKGNGTNCARIVPNSAVKFFSYEQASKYVPFSFFFTPDLSCPVLVPPTYLFVIFRPSLWCMITVLSWNWLEDLFFTHHSYVSKAVIDCCCFSLFFTGEFCGRTVNRLGTVCLCALILRSCHHGTCTQW